MKNLNIILTGILVILTTKVALGDECGKTTVSTIRQESEMDVVTSAPKFLQKATITITQANGKSETVSADDYMVVKRKHKRPLSVILLKQNTLQCKNTSKKNIISGKLVDGYSDVSTKVNGKSATISLDRQLGVGLQYQRRIMERVYLGVGADSNKGTEALLGFDF
jgi:hypothetical protein